MDLSHEHRTGKADKNYHPGTSFMVQWLKLHLPIQGMHVWFLVRELRSYMPFGQKKKSAKNQKSKQKHYCKKFNKNFKSGPHQKTNKQTNKSYHASCSQDYNHSEVNSGKAIGVFPSLWVHFPVLKAASSRTPHGPILEGFVLGD